MLALQLITSAAFAVLGVTAATGWMRRRDNSLGWLSLAISLLAVVSLVQAATSILHSLFGFHSGWLGDVSLLLFVASAYALLRYRASFIPISRAFHRIAGGAIAVATVAYLAAQVGAATGAVQAQVAFAAVLVLVAIWAAVVTESIVRFWLVARELPAVQAWRLRSLSIGFAGIVAVLVFVIAASVLGEQPLAQVVTQLVALAIVPLLYVSFAPPAWLRREWRSAEEEGLRAFMEELLLSDDRDALARRAVEWAMRLTGGGAAASFDGKGRPVTVVGLDGDSLQELGAALPRLGRGVHRIAVAGTERTALAVPIRGLADSGTLVVIAGPYTPGFGGDELSRVRQFMSAFVTALDRRHLIVQLEESNERLQEANRHKSIFLASMSHELRTPLNAILGFSELLLDADRDQFEASTRRRFLEQIHSSGRHLLGLINDILDLSKVEAGQMELRLQAVDIADTVQQVLQTVEPLAAHKNISIVVREQRAGVITADAGKVKQMLLNLVSNAVKFTDEGGTVTVTTGRLDDSVEISVADTGIGIAKQDYPRVFQEFQQLDSGVGRQQGGTGLGLALTRRFANLHGGEVTFESELGKGTVFTIKLPVEARHAPATAPSAPVVVRQGDDPRPLVLIVEDDAAAAELLSRQIERAGFRTEVARTGKLALAAARARKPAAITLDILLPDLDGWEVLTRLKKDEATGSIPVVVVSVVDNPELGTALGALDYFVKPVPANQLMARLEKFRRVPGDGKTTVLVVDDEEANREWLRHILEPAGFSVIVAEGGQEAIDMARANPPDLVLLDLMMPGVTGFDVVEALRGTAATQNIPIMVLTAKTLTELDRRQLNGHVATILRRGSTGAADLLSLLKQVVAGAAVL